MRGEPGRWASCWVSTQQWRGPAVDLVRDRTKGKACLTGRAVIEQRGGTGGRGAGGRNRQGHGNMARSLTRPAERVQSTQTVGRSGSGVSTVTCSEIGPLARGPSATCGLDWRRWECRGWVDVMQSCKAAKEKRSHTHVALPRSRPRPRLPPPPPPPRCTAGPTRGGGLQVQTVKRRWMPKRVDVTAVAHLGEMEALCHVWAIHGFEDCHLVPGVERGAFWRTEEIKRLRAVRKRTGRIGRRVGGSFRGCRPLDDGRNMAG